MLTTEERRASIALIQNEFPLLPVDEVPGIVDYVAARGAAVYWATCREHGWSVPGHLIAHARVVCEWLVEEKVLHASAEEKEIAALFGTPIAVIVASRKARQNKWK